MNYSLTCLPAERVGNEIIDCLGASDELYFCRELYPAKKDYERFLCSDSDLCLSASDLSDNIRSCPLGDDENFCKDHQFICQDDSSNNDSLIEDVLCQLSEYKRNRIIYFSIHTSLDYPQSKFVIMNQTVHWTKEQQRTNLG